MKEGDLVLAIFGSDIRICKVGMLENRNTSVRLIPIGNGKPVWRKRKHLVSLTDLIKRYKGGVK